MVIVIALVVIFILVSRKAIRKDPMNTGHYTRIRSHNRGRRVRHREFPNKGKDIM